MRVLHTADWHLGKSLQGQPREYEHRQFLSWLLDLLEEEQVDVLLHAGDVFDTFNPPAYAERLWYEFLDGARRRCPQLDIVVIAGNHDSAARLEAPSPMLEAMGIHVVGRLPCDAQGNFEPERLVVPLRDGRGEVAAWCMAVPFLRRSDLPAVDEGEDALSGGVRRRYASVAEAAKARQEPGQALIAMGHLTVQGGGIGKLTEDSERPIHIGGQSTMGPEIFGEGLDYVALGHLHLPQGLKAPDGRSRVQYSGSPIPLSVSEIDYEHQVALIDFEAGELVEWRKEVVPRAVELLRIPEEGEASLEEILEACAAFPQRGEDAAEDKFPFLDLHVKLPSPTAGLRHQIEEALQGRAVRLVRIATRYEEASREDGPERVDLETLTPEEVFRRCHRERRSGEEPSDALLDAFQELFTQITTEASR